MKQYILLINLLLSFPVRAADEKIPEEEKHCAQLEVSRKGIFEPHLRKIEEDLIRQMTFKIRVRKHATEEDCVKISIEGFLRDKRMMKQTVDISY